MRMRVASRIVFTVENSLTFPNGRGSPHSSANALTRSAMDRDWYSVTSLSRRCDCVDCVIDCGGRIADCVGGIVDCVGGIIDSGDCIIDNGGGIVDCGDCIIEAGE